MSYLLCSYFRHVLFVVIIGGLIFFWFFFLVVFVLSWFVAIATLISICLLTAGIFRDVNILKYYASCVARYVFAPFYSELVIAL